MKILLKHPRHFTYQERQLSNCEKNAPIDILSQDFYYSYLIIVADQTRMRSHLS